MSDVAHAAAPVAPAAPATATVTAPPAATAAPAAPAATTTVAPGVTINVQPPVASSTSTAAAPAAPPAPAAGMLSQDEVERIVRERLERDRKSRLKDLGADSDDEVKVALAAHKQKVESDKTLDQKRVEAEQRAAAETSRAAKFEADLRAEVDAKMAAVPQNIRDAVIDLAGDDVSLRLKALRRLAPLGSPAAPPPATPAAAAPAALPAAAPAPTATPAAEVPVTLIRLADGRLAQIVDAAPPAAAPPPAPATGTQAKPPSNVSTAPPPGGPPAQAATETTALGKMQSLAKSHPTAGAYYALANARALDREMQKP